jgi:hypothetical protein
VSYFGQQLDLSSYRDSTLLGYPATKRALWKQIREPGRKAKARRMQTTEVLLERKT